MGAAIIKGGGMKVGRLADLISAHEVCSIGALVGIDACEVEDLAGTELWVLQLMVQLYRELVSTREVVRSEVREERFVRQGL